jgi:serine/threonine protein kinase
MEVAHGGDLRSLVCSYRREKEQNGIENTACDYNVARFYMAEIVEACEYLHSMNIIHRDLKPENILISANGHIKVTDFGTSIIVNNVYDDSNNEEARNSFVGTAEYVSPEVSLFLYACMQCLIFGHVTIVGSTRSICNPFM